MEIYTRVKHADYIKLVERCETLEKENAKLKAELKKKPAKVIANIEVKTDELVNTAMKEIKKEIKKGGNK